MVAVPGHVKRRTIVRRVAAEKSANAGTASDEKGSKKRGARKERATPGQEEIFLTETVGKGNGHARTGNSRRVRNPHLPVPLAPFTGCHSGPSRSWAVPTGTRTASDRSPAFRDRGR